VPAELRESKPHLVGCLRDHAVTASPPARTTSASDRTRDANLRHCASSNACTCVDQPCGVLTHDANADRGTPISSTAASRASIPGGAALRSYVSTSGSCSSVGRHRVCSIAVRNATLCAFAVALSPLSILSARTTDAIESPSGPHHVNLTRRTTRD